MNQVRIFFADPSSRSLYPSNLSLENVYSAPMDLAVGENSVRAQLPTDLEVRQGMGLPGASQVITRRHPSSPTWRLTSGATLVPVAAATLGGAVYLHVESAGEDHLFLRTTSHISDFRDRTFFGVVGNQLLRALNHRTSYSHFDPETETEHKLTLSEDRSTADVADILLTAVASWGDFEPDFQDELEQWSFENYLYEIDGPAAERGYVSFIPTVDGKSTVKRKWYDADTLQRREVRYAGQPIRDGEDRLDWLAKAGLNEARYLGAFTRDRIDVSAESIKTGNVFALMIDHCRTLDGTRTLRQVEIEYFKTRSLLPPVEALVLEELEVVVERVRRAFQCAGVEWAEGFYSKKSWLKGAPLSPAAPLSD